jgi:molybdopterin biosynthesis enzyme
VGTIDPQDFGRLEGEVTALRREVDLMRDDIKELLAAVENAKGGWRVLLAVGGVAGALGALVVKGWAFFGGAPK